MPLEIKIKRLSSSRSIRLRVYADGSVVVTAPKRASQQRIEEFIAENNEWLTEKYQKAIDTRERLTRERDHLFYRGKEYNFRLSVSSTKKPGVSLDQETITVTAKSEVHGEVRMVLEKWYRKEAEKRFVERVPLLADLVNREVKRVVIRDQRTRWGSCSSRNTISLNWRLIMAPDSVSDYVIYHELAHLTHMNHSDRFWSLVGDYFPGYEKAEKWLKQHQKLLQF